MTQIRVRSTRSIPRPTGATAVLAGVVALLFVGMMLTILLAVAIWPGEVKLVAPLFCDDAQPDAFVVADTYSPRPGETTTNFTLYCMGPNGDATDHGFFLPFLATMALNIGVLVGLVLALRAIRRLRGPAPPGPPAARERAPASPGSTAGPFVD